ncbi:rRNA N6-adenosine-methyltransferase ZCCHC4 [Corythoichthys intestinalis]|uniref:rRNA N6-adenosine-methyltransferase ZCCHC4 n=1 Tax=Corythoichthys intestinalis TaxID=161448 RepID=UPI0025A5DE00|nr:rRNA N6-adenosine-methyltransferase ZCCHC4 [Corythoichthys intestinalis]XP_061810822.1 rRNA N6-adenosine-methyltransferase ZCCHC4-like [Nerophis lumbriciformis]
MDTTGLDDSCLGYEVILKDDDTSTPRCPHGPTLLFEKQGKGGQRFYACSACRDRKECSFFQWEDEKVSEVRKMSREAENQRKKLPPFSQEQYSARFQQFLALAPDQMKFCQDCQLLLLPDEMMAHGTHAQVPVAIRQLRRPSGLLRPLDNKKSHAQYLFTERTARFLLSTLTDLGYNKVLCVGTPRLHELIKTDGKSRAMTSLLLDIDFRYGQFYSQNEFCHYNMFNHHFFDSQTSSEVVRAFLRESNGEKAVMVADPPFGGLVKPLAKSFSRISQTWRELQSDDSSNVDIPMIWIFPYFFEPRILECLPSLTMLDYQVDYDNHSLYKHGKTGRKQSPVRLFTNITPSKIALPEDEGYRFCAICARYVWSLNTHCLTCNVCPSKDGRQWKHCSLCERCVKPSWRHCQSCDRCALPDHPCNQSKVKEGCFNCASLGHKRKSCPRKRVSRGGSKSKRRNGVYVKQPAKKMK